MYANLYNMICVVIERGVKSEIFIDGIRIAKFLASPNEVKRKCKELFEKSVIGSSLKSIAYDGYIGFQLSLKAFLEFVLSTPRYLEMIIEYNVKKKTETLELMVNCDALPVAGGHSWIVSYSLGNFGILCKSVYGRFIGNIANLNDKNTLFNVMKAMWGDNLETISLFAQAKMLEFRTEERSFISKVKVIFGGDDSNNRNLKGLNSNSAKFFCSNCYSTKEDWQNNNPVTILRTEALAEEKFLLNNVRVTSQANRPMIKYVHILHLLLSSTRANYFLSYYCLTFLGI